MGTMTPDKFSNDSLYVSAPTSPKRLSTDTICFYSVPTSPAGNSFIAMYDVETQPTAPISSYEDANTNTGFIDFEFETSRRFNLDGYDIETGPDFDSSPYQRPQQQQQQQESLPAMAFADELFCDGKVMPLKPPPRLRYGKDQNNSALTSPRSPLRFPFRRKSLWNDDFDPFMVALENVKQEKNRDKTHRRARSMSPLRAKSPQKPDTDTHSVAFSHKNIKQSGTNSEGLKELNFSASATALNSIWVPNQNGQLDRQETEKQVQKGPIRLAEPKGVLFARSARLVKMGHEKPSKPSTRKLHGATDTGEGSKEGERSCTTGTKRQKIKKFLLRSASIGITSSEEKQKDESKALHKRSFTRKFSFKSKRLAQYNEEKGVAQSQATTMAIMQYRPKLLQCMGYGTKYVS